MPGGDDEVPPEGFRGAAKPTAPGGGAVKEGAGNGQRECEGGG